MEAWSRESIPAIPPPARTAFCPSQTSSANDDRTFSPAPKSFGVSVSAVLPMVLPSKDAATRIFVPPMSKRTKHPLLVSLFLNKSNIYIKSNF